MPVFSLNLDSSIFQRFDIPDASDMYQGSDIPGVSEGYLAFGISTRRFPEVFYVLKNIPYIIHVYYLTAAAIRVNVYEYTELPLELTPRVLREVVRKQLHLTHIRQKSVGVQPGTQIISFKPFTYNGTSFNFTITKDIEVIPGGSTD